MTLLIFNAMSMRNRIKTEMSSWSIKINRKGQKLYGDLLVDFQFNTTIAQVFFLVDSNFGDSN